ncbi:DUF1798 family protein [Halalkalibacillus halophilus]|uniref:DUF1798 family protein n=1 Tax=Halalkalibacillus halophilus TaxID=392827 RepID=UPI00047FA151|nr:DUF1798 family protein [Halalkalibacillus halophilus]
MDPFIELSKYLRHTILEDCLYQYMEGRKHVRKDYDDFNLVKEETKPMFEAIEKWEEDAQAIVHRLPIFPNQIQNTKDNLEIMILHSFFHDVKKKRFMELYHSVMYNLDIVLNDEQ